MKIAVVSAAISNKSGSRAPVELAVHLAKLGHIVSFFAFNTPFEQEAQEYLKQNKVQTFILGSPSICGRWAAACKLLKLLELLKIEIISTHCTFPLSVASWLSRKPVVKTYYGLQFFSWNAMNWREKLVAGLLDKIIVWREWLTFRMAPKVVAISGYLSKEAKGILGKEAEFIYIGVSQNPNSKIPASPAGRQSSNQIQMSKYKNATEVLVLSVSRIVPYKGFDVLIQALKKIDLPWRLVVVGSYGKESYFQKIKALADERVTFLRGISDSELYDLYDLCDLYSLGGKVWEGFGMPFLEAGLHSKPLVAFSHSALPEVVLHGKTGYLAETDKEFAQYLEKLIKDKDQRQKMGQSALEHSQSFTWQKCAESYEKVFEKQLKT
ncbi:MAG: glycosyltransferase family 4 protein [bacterium]